MRWTRRASMIVVFVGWMACAAPALALSIAPPGKAGANQYFETLPSSGGNVAPPSGGKHDPGALPGQGRAGATRLGHLGSDGQAAATLAEATAPASKAHHGSSTSTASAAAAAAQGSSAASGLSHVITGSDAGGLGPLLPILLATALIAAVGLAVARIRRGNPPEIGA